VRLATLMVLAASALALTGVARAGTNDLVIKVDRTAISTKLGRTFVFHSTIANRGKVPARGLVAHLNVLSLRDGVYVDPEDWSSQRTRYLAPIPGGGSTTLSWKLQAVTSGSIGIYVALLPQNGAAQPPRTGALVHVSVAERKTLNSGGVLPLALGIPAALGVLFVGSRRLRQ
jgi:hypothetical protein